MRTPISASLSLLAGFWLLVAGCATPLRQSANKPLVAGEAVRVYFRAFGPDTVPTVYTIDDRGFLTFSPQVSVEVAGLLPAEAASRIRGAFVPRYYRSGEVEITRVQRSR